MSQANKATRPSLGADSLCMTLSMPMSRRDVRFPDNPAGKSWTRTNIAEGVEPSAFPLGLYMQAAVCELADRTQASDWSPNLATVLCPDAPMPAPRPPPRR